MKKTICFLLIGTVFLLFTACGNNQVSSSFPPSSSPVASVVFTSEEQFTERDLQGAYDTASAQTLFLPQGGTTLTISEEGIYLLQGEGTGQILVDAPKDAKIQLVFCGVRLSCETSAPIYVKQANKVFITLEKDSANALSCGESLVQTDENTVDGVIFAKDDLTLNGEGSLTITAPGCHGIVAKDDLVLSVGSLSVTAKGHGISANNSVRIASGYYAITSQKDGIKAEHDEDTSLGYIYIQNGEYTINATGDGISSSGICQIETGLFTLSTGEKGIKSGSNLLLQEGSYTLYSEDDCLHANNDLTIAEGNYTLESGDDGVHANGNLTILEGTIGVTSSYEALEGHTITIAGGNHNLTADDDGLNCAGGNDQSGFGGRGGDQFAEDEEAFLLISDGHIIINAEGDGLDSNGSLTITGGEVYVYGPTRGGNGAIDANGEKKITGGILVAVGTADMAENFDSATQGTALVSLNGQANASLTLENQKGEILLLCTPQKSYQCVVISCPKMEQGETYTLKTDDQTATFTLTDMIYGQGMGMGNPGGGGNFGGGGRPGGGGGRPGGFGW